MLIGLLVESSSDEELASKLYQCLKRQRYIVVMDDVWSEEAWDDVSKCLPDDGNGSCVLVTTRLVDVANYISPDNDFCHQMQLLDQSDIVGIYLWKGMQISWC